MRIELHTWRYGQETTLQYHGKTWRYDAHNMVLEIIEPVIEKGAGAHVIARATVVTSLTGEQFTVFPCSRACELHGNTVGDGEPWPDYLAKREGG